MKPATTDAVSTVEDAEGESSDKGTNHISNLLPVSVMPASNNDSSSSMELVSVADVDVDTICD